MTQAAIIGAIRRGLKRGPLPADQQAMLRTRLATHPRHIIPARGQLDRQGRVTLFAAYVEREFGTVDRLAGLADVPEAVAAYLARQNLAPSIVVSPHPELQGIDFAAKPLLDVRFGVCGPNDLVTIQHAFAAVAETGTLMLPSGPERPTSNNLLPDNAIVVLHANRIAASYEDAFDWLRQARPDDEARSAQSESGRALLAKQARPDDEARGAKSESGRALLPRNIMLVTGPSRSADIEQTLELGAHGPRRLHVLIIDGPG